MVTILLNLFYLWGHTIKMLYMIDVVYQFESLNKLWSNENEMFVNEFPFLNLISNSNMKLNFHLMNMFWVSVCKVGTVVLASFNPVITKWINKLKLLLLICFINVSFYFVSLDDPSFKIWTIFITICFPVNING